MSESTIVKTSCGICSQCCPVDAYICEGELKHVEGSRSTRSGSGKLCVKGMTATQFVYNKERIRYPMKRVGKKGEGKFERISWEEAYDLIAENLLRIKEETGAKSTVFYNGYPKWFRPAFLRLANAYGSPNFCTESSTCFQSVAIAWRSIYGNKICPPDLSNSKTLLLWSSNLYHSDSAMSSLYQKLKENGVKIIAVDSRHSVTAHDAHIHLQPEAGTDGALALSMAYVIIEENLYDREFVERYVYGFEAYKDYVSNFKPERAEEITKVPAARIREAARLFARNKPSSIKFSASAIVHHINGFQNQRAIFALGAITGNYDVKGGNCPHGGIASPCNEFGKVERYDKEEAVGEREFPAWFDLEKEEAQCTKLADYILEECPYPIRAIVAFGLNHRMWPQPEHLQRALEKLDFYVNVDLFLSESSAAADLVLPACTSYEREEVQVKKGGRFFFSRMAVEPVGESKNDIEIIIELLKHMKLHDEVLEQGYEAYMQHIIEPSGLTLEQLKTSPDGMQGRNCVKPSYQSYEKMPFDTPSGKIELKSLVLDKYKESNGYDALPVFHDYRTETKIDRSRYPFILSTGCRKPQYFHARTYRMPWLAGLETAPLVEMHPEDARELEVEEGKAVSIISPAGEVDGTVAYNINGLRGTVYLYHGYAGGDANELIDKDYIDPISGFPGFKSYFCRIERI